MNKRFVLIMGTHGSGKSTLARNILKYDAGDCVLNGALFDSGDYFMKTGEAGVYTVSNGGNIVAVGSYHNKCGGADGIARTEDYFNLIRWLITKGFHTVVVEGAMQHSYDSLVDLFKWIASMGYIVTVCLLDVSISNAVDRVCNRNGRHPNEKNVLSKINGMRNQFEKFNALNEFNCFVIDTNGLDDFGVYDTFEMNL